MPTLTQIDTTKSEEYTATMKEKLFTLQEVAKMLRVSERSVFRYIHSGKLKATKIGYWRIMDKDLKSFLQQGTK